MNNEEYKLVENRIREANNDLNNAVGILYMLDNDLALVSGAVGVIGIAQRKLADLAAYIERGIQDAESLAAIKPMVLDKTVSVNDPLVGKKVCIVGDHMRRGTFGVVRFKSTYSGHPMYFVELNVDGTGCMVKPSYLLVHPDNLPDPVHN